MVTCWLLRAGHSCVLMSSGVSWPLGVTRNVAAWERRARERHKRRVSRTVLLISTRCQLCSLSHARAPHFLERIHNSLQMCLQAVTHESQRMFDSCLIVGCAYCMLHHSMPCMLEIGSRTPKMASRRSAHLPHMAQLQVQGPHQCVICTLHDPCIQHLQTPAAAPWQNGQTRSFISIPPQRNWECEGKADNLRPKQQHSKSEDHDHLA